MSVFTGLFSGQRDSNDSIIQYENIKVTDLQDSELKECSDLFGKYYGRYNELSDFKPGGQIKMSVRLYKENYCKPNYYAALAKENGKLIGQAFYFRKDYSKQGYGTMTWVVQLVVDDNYRRRGIASTLLQSIWGFSDDYAWGLATTNPCTIKTLESATFRKCKPSIVNKHLKAIKLIQDDVPFAKGKEIYISGMTSQIDTNFYVDNSPFVRDENDIKKYGKLKPGYEWLAFTFRDQGIQKDKYKKHFGDLIGFSEIKLKEAYSRMNMSEHPWATGTRNEVDFIEKFGEGKDVLDLGCGIGRHSIMLAEDGYKVIAVDFSEKNIQEAKNRANEQSLLESDCKFIVADARTYESKKQFDKVVCLYDVIGSFSDNEDNKKIIKTAYNNLKAGGYFILSVMNMEYTDYIVPAENRGNIAEDINVLLKLQPSRIMQSSGNIFNPDYLAIDNKTRLVYRKEQFSDDGLSAEYVICDKRYTKDEISDLLRSAGFEIVQVDYVIAGHFGYNLRSIEDKAKEICIVARK